MTTTEFCYWLQGFFEIQAASDNPGRQLSPKQVEIIQRHLSLVFKHDIDPKAGSPAHQEVLQGIHDGTLGPSWPTGLVTRPSGTVFRC
jgi:hypothetical protein